jgi:2-polyprenyl-3-methyl-5-hydroxy-6-metoxy-1,4-benzoquinol methylase
MANLMLTQDITNLRILEIGCGIGLSSLVLNHRDADITATDYHPEARLFLEQNVILNESKEIEFHLCDWKDENETLGRFDLIIGSDLLYEADHSSLLASFIDKHVNPKAQVIIVSPKRGYQSKFNSEMQALSYSHEKIKPLNTEYLKDNFNGFIHRYLKS